VGKSNSFRFAEGLINGESVAAGIIRENDMAELISMMNIGKEMAKRLDSVGIGSAEELVRSGAEQAFLKLKERYPNVCLVHLYALEGAVCNVEFNSLPKGRKRELKEYSDFLKG
jgi:DNA transformation protein